MSEKNTKVSNSKFNPHSLVGKKINMLTILDVVQDEYVIKDTGKKNRIIKYKCKCDCGNEKIISKESLIYCNTMSCGCYQKRRASETSKKNRIGIKFGKLTVIDEVEPYVSPSGDTLLKYKCICDCGNTVEVLGCHLTSGLTVSCGCFKLSATSKSHTKDIKGEKFGRLTVEEMLSDFEDKKFKKTYWRCRCDCGNEFITYTSNLTTGNTSSCGCKKESRGEKIISDFLKKYHIKFESEKTFKNLKSKKGWSLRVDFYLPDYNTVIEYQGKQHFEMCNFSGDNKRDKENFEHQIENDLIKSKYFNQNKINMIEIPYTMRDDMVDVLKIILGIDR